jgi:hypothetical protein
LAAICEEVTNNIEDPLALDHAHWGTKSQRNPGGGSAALLWDENNSRILRRSVVEHHFNNDAEMSYDTLTRDLLFHLHPLGEKDCNQLGVGFYFLAELIPFFEIHEAYPDLGAE